MYKNKFYIAIVKNVTTGDMSGVRSRLLAVFLILWCKVHGLCAGNSRQTGRGRRLPANESKRSDRV